MKELVSLFRMCVQDKSVIGIRDAIVLAALYSTGLRRSELLALDVAGYKDGTLTVKGNGNKVSLAYVVGEAKTILERWLAIPAGPGEAVFVAITQGGRVTANRPDGRSLAEIPRRRAEEAGIPPFSPHDLRLTTATDLLDGRIDIGTGQQIHGHRHVAATLLYDRRGEPAKQRAEKMLVMSPSFQNEVPHRD